MMHTLLGLECAWLGFQADWALNVFSANFSTFRGICAFQADLIIQRYRFAGSLKNWLQLNVFQSHAGDFSAFPFTQRWLDLGAFADGMRTTLMQSTACWRI